MTLRPATEEEMAQARESAGFRLSREAVLARLAGVENTRGAGGA